MKRTLLLLSGLLILMVWLLPAGGLSSQAQAADDPNVTITLQVGQPNSSVNGVDQEIDPGMGTAPVIVNGRTFVPIRSIIESMGGTISWNGQEQKVSISLNNNIIELTIGSLQASVNGDTKTLEAAPFISSTGRTMLPLRFITENLGSEVAWDGPTQTITIEYGPDNITPPPAAVETADFSGTWDMVVNDEDMGDMKLVLTQDGTAVSGYFGYDSESGKAFAGTVAGNTLSGKFSTTNPVSEWEFTVTMAADGNSFTGMEYYSSPAWAVSGVRN